jgi:hypothetical protein
MGDYNLLVRKISAMAPPPCDDCEHMQACCDEEMACRLYWKYSLAGAGAWLKAPDRNPSRFIYQKIFKQVQE